MSGFSTQNIKTGQMFYLHSRKILNDNISYYFSYEIVDCIPRPDGYEVIYNYTGQPVLKRSKND